MNHLVYSTETDRYALIEENTSLHQRRCIDHSVTGSNKCVGYCQFPEHPGFLTEKLRKNHSCLEKKCHYYIGKTKKLRKEISNNEL